MKHEPLQLPTGFRTRLAVTFVATAGIAAGLLALGSYLIVHQVREGSARDRAERQTRFNLALADDILSAGFDDSDVDRLLTLYERREGFDTVILQNGAALGVADPSLLNLSDRESPLSSEIIEAEVEGEPFIVTQGNGANGDLQLRFFFPQAELHDELNQLRNVLGAGWLIVLGVLAVTGRIVARRILNPVIDASHAARSLAEGLLDTRLRVGSEDEFGVLASSFNEMADELQAKIIQLSEAHEWERRFTSDVSHELRTPIASLAAAASILDKHIDAVPSPARRPAELVIGDSARLRSLIDEVMEISRLDSGTAVIDPRPVDVRSALEDILVTNGWDSEVKLNAVRGRITTDPRRFRRIMVNLVGNALRHGAPPVELSTAVDDGWMNLEVSDGGEGIPEKDLPHIFDRFYKGDESRSTSGSGLGLAIAAENARLIGGSIDVVSPEEGRTRFTVRLPVRADSTTR